MLRLLISIFYVSCFVSILSAQVNFDKHIIRECKLTCEEIAQTASELFVRYMSTNKNDSLLLHSTDLGAYEHIWASFYNNPTDGGYITMGIS